MASAAKVVTIASPKGGASKTSTTTLPAVRALQDDQRVCLLDLNADQGSLTQWHAFRGSPAAPHLGQEIENITGDVARIKASGRFDWVFIDTPPQTLDIIENAVMLADAVIVPVRCFIFDIGAIDAVVEMCRQHGRPFKFLLSDVDGRFKGLTNKALAALADHGDVCATRVSHRLACINALTIGKAGHEIDTDLKPEADALWSEVRALAAGPRSARSVERRATAS